MNGRKLALALVLMMGVASPLAAQTMDSYCSVPPYASRSLAPNVMVLMDNSLDMLNPAYTGSYTTDETKKDNYTGYFKPTGCYSYSGKFVEALVTDGAYQRTYRAGETCPSTAPFRGNLMNWATMSRFDIMQKVLIGGNTASKQGNAHTLLSTSGTWADKTHDNCIFKVSGGSVIVTETVFGACKLIAASPGPIALNGDPDSPARIKVASWSHVFAWLSGRVSTLLHPMMESLVRAWDTVTSVTQAWAGHTLAIQITSGTLSGAVQVPYSLTLECSGSGSACPNNLTYSWSFTGTALTWLSGESYADGSGNRIKMKVTRSGTPPTAGNYTLNATLSASGHTSVTTTYTIVVAAGAPQITTTALPNGNVSSAYTTTVSGQGGVPFSSPLPPYTWSHTGLNAAGLNLTINASTGEITGTPTVAGTYTVTVKLTDANGQVATKTYSITIGTVLTVNSATYIVKVELLEELFTDLNGNDIWDAGESYTESNGNGVWDGKQGVFQKFWDANTPKARWGLTKFGNGGSVEIDACIPYSPASSFFTRIQNAQPVATSPLAEGLYVDINYFGFKSPYTTTSGCSNADPIDNVPCRKNFVLILSSGTSVAGASTFSNPPFPPSPQVSPDCPSTEKLVKNACYGNKIDHRSDKTGKQNVYTYIVNTMGTTNTTILTDAAAAGGGKFYNAADGSQLEAQLVNAFTDILAQAASGTSVSVLTTSSRGTGSLAQAYFLPSRLEGTRDVYWTGYTQNIWIDPQDNLREDTINDKALKQAEDNVMKLYFDASTNETKAAMFTTDAEGAGGTLATCGTPTIKPFGDIKYLWDAGKALALKDHGARKLFTSKKVLYGSTTTQTFTESAGVPYTKFDTSMNATLKAALNPDTTYTNDLTIQYIRGEAVEATNTSFRDRRVTVDGTLKTWKLGDIISSTPKVFAGTPANTYHIDYGDNTYYDYVSGADYQTRSAITFVGANDGVLHAFRMGYLKDTGLAAGIKALFQNTQSDSGNSQLGDEVWGYIPFNSFPYLKYLASPGYCHIYFNDLSVRLVDASISGSPTDTRTASSWKTILIGGMRFGGACNGGTPAIPIAGVGYSSYFALDITNPEIPVPLWEFSDPDLGYTTSVPSVVRTGGTSKNGDWYVAVGSGSTRLSKGNTDIARSTPGYVYILNLATGALVKKIALDHNAIVGDILAIDADKNYAAEKLYFGTAYDPAAWKGKLVSIAIPNQDLTTWTPTSSDVKYLFTGPHAFTASPDSARDTNGNIWVYAGSGKYYSDVDEADPQSQLFFGLQDKPSGITYPVTTATLDDRTNVTTVGTVTGTTQACLYNAATNAFSLQTLVTSINQTSSPVAP
ncbi:MAG: PilC/PilY family type IV pilus protein, partial [Nitrospiria bacterium]